ncbi:hypothetical protein JW766_06360 [Candidatus Dojkabacteria bacterium]|nr:hypothetical protein [Candidatus Dojkabacteria bacterium]
MYSPYDLLKITENDLHTFKNNSKRGKVRKILNLVLNELPPHLKRQVKFTKPNLKPVRGFEDDKVKGYEIIIKNHKEIESFVRSYVPFFIMEK